LTPRPDELAAELYLEEDISPAAPYQPVSAPQVVLVTGATGFLGAFVVRDLLRMTGATIYCLVRAQDADAARQRLAANFAHYRIEHPELTSRVVVVTGNAELPRLGIDDPVYEWLATHVDTIYHLAASVSFMPGYEQLKAINVTGLKHVLRLACARRTKIVHYTSTYAVFNSDAYALAQRVHETRLVGSSEGFPRGYDRSKWVAEKLVELAQQRGLPVTMYRAGFISGDTRTGIHNKMDPVAQMLAVCLCTGHAFHLDVHLHLTPVDFCSRALVKISLHAGSENRIFHLVQPAPIPTRRLLDWMIEEGVNLKLVPYAAWYEQLRIVCRKYPQFIPAFYLSSREQTRAFGEGENLSSLYFDTINVDQILPPEERCPAMEPPLLRRYLDYIASPDRGYEVVVRRREGRAS
jgi:thioester reductase-like protein